MRYLLAALTLALCGLSAEAQFRRQPARPAVVQSCPGGVCVTPGTLPPSFRVNSDLSELFPSSSGVVPAKSSPPINFRGVTKLQSPPKVRVVGATAAPTPDEWTFFKLLNEARADPTAYGKKVGVDLSYIAPSAPLIFDGRAQKVAHDKAADMLARQYFSHTTPEGKNCGHMLTEEGYAWNSWSESIAGGYPNPAEALRALIRDDGIPSLGHRHQLLAHPPDRGSRHVHVGIGVAGNQGTHFWSGYFSIVTTAGSETVPVPEPQPPDPPPLPDPNSPFKGTDTTSKGDGRTTYPNAVALTLPGASTWTWANPTADVRALPVVPVPRAATCFYSATSFEVGLPTDQRRIAAYFLDWDNGGRRQRVELLDATTGAVLDSREVSAFAGGVWLKWDATVPVKLRVTRLAGPNCVLSDVRGW